MPREIVCDTVFWGNRLLTKRNLAAFNWCLAPISGGWVVVCDTVFRGVGPDAIFGGTSLERKGVGGQFWGRRDAWAEIESDTVLRGNRLLTIKDLAANNWCLAPISGAWDIVCDTVFCGVGLGAIFGGTSLLGERRGLRAEIVCDTVFGGGRLLKTQGLTANNWCLAPIIWGEGNCV